MKASKRVLFLSYLILPLCCSLQARGQNRAAAGDRTNESRCFRVADDNKEMAEAVEKANKTLNQFVDALKSPKSNQTCFAVKKPFIEGDKVEHIWVSDVTFDGKVFRGKIDNEPEDVKRVHLGDTVTVRPQEISDWMFVQNGRLVGGYTVRCSCQGMTAADKKQFEAETGCRMD
jgi:uncharacterized protein YegJ (DUF2314 family)